jgi:methylmalonyl-CoA mutase N-terminal domain/subunit
LQRVRSQRDATRVTKALADLKTAATGNANLMPFIIEAVRAYAGIGEICEALQSVFGEYTPV